jgi:hypothetical protein
MRTVNEVDVLGQEAKIPIHSSRFLLRHLPMLLDSALLASLRDLAQDPCHSIPTYL